MATGVETGRCFCGAIRFEAAGAPLWVAHCHCHSCRRSTGAPVTTFVGFSREQVRFIRGERRFYASSPGVRRGFCATCGTPLTYEADHVPTEIHFYVSTMDAPERFVPDRHVYYEEKIPWLELDDDASRHRRASGSRATDSGSSSPR